MKKGFTLIELAIVLVLVGLLLGLGTSLVGILIKQVKRRETQERLDAAVESVIGYAQTHKYLPDNATFFSVVRTPRDTYGKPFIYIYYSALAGSGGYCGKKESPITIRICHDNGCSSYEEIKNVAFLVLSSGENYNIQTYLPNPSAVSSDTVIKIYDYGIKVDDYPSDMNRVEEYDDQVKWITLSELRRKADCKPLAIISPENLPKAEEDSPYSYQLEAEGGKPPYSWSGLVGSGLNLDSEGRVWGTVNLNTSTSTGELTTCNGSITFNATVKDSVNDTEWKIFNIRVEPKALRIITDTLPIGYVGSSYAAKISAQGGVIPYSWSMTGTCPPGLTCSGNTISGTPSKSGSYDITVTVTDHCGFSYSRKYTLVVNP